MVPLTSIDARIAAETLKPLVGRGGVVVPTPQGNGLLVADYADNIRRIRGLIAEIDIPPTIQALVAARLDALHAEERQVVDPASVIGLGFAVEAVANLVPAEAALDVPARLATLTAKQLVRPAASDSDFYR